MIDFRGQFLLSSALQPSLSGWQSDSIDGWVLQSCPSLPVRSLRRRSGERAGWILGYPIAGECAFPLTLPIEGNESDRIRELEASIADLAGRFVVIVVSEKNQRIYLDPAGQLGVVYNSTRQMVGSSLRLVSSLDRPDRELIEKLGIPENDFYFPFGLTPDKEVKRILPNHFLNLVDFCQKRHWPRADQLSTGVTLDVERVVGAIASQIESNILSVVSQFPVVMSLTAGRDSRMLLAAARKVCSNIEFFTSGIPDKSARLDCEVARVLAKRFKLRHRILKWEQASNEELETWQERVGDCVAGRTWKSVRTLKQLDPHRIFMPGLCGEVGRSFYWTQEDFQQIGATPHDVVTRLGLPPLSPLLAQAEHWLGNLPFSHRLDILDFLYIEQRLGCWAGASHYGHAHHARTVPLSDRRIFGLMLQLPYEYRFQNRLASDLIKLLWPALLRYPFNETIRLFTFKKFFRGITQTAGRRM